jgi:hypothetical protein
VGGTNFGVGGRGVNVEIADGVTAIIGGSVVGGRGVATADRGGVIVSVGMAAWSRGCKDIPAKYRQGLKRFSAVTIWWEPQFLLPLRPRQTDLQAARYNQQW